MNEVQIVSLVSLAGFLALNLAGYRHYNVGWRKTLYMAGLWAGIFAIVVLFIDMVR